MVSSDIAFLSASETAKAIRTKQVSPVEVVQAYLARITRLDATSMRILLFYKKPLCRQRVRQSSNL